MGFSQNNNQNAMRFNTGNAHKTINPNKPLNSSIERENEQLKSIEEDVDSIFRTLGELIDSIGHKMTFEEFLDITGEYVDNKIISCARAERLAFAGGTCVFTVDNRKHVLNTAVDLYFKDEHDKWAKKTLSGSTRLSKFTDDAIKGKLTEIYRAGGEKFPISEPEER